MNTLNSLQSLPVDKGKLKGGRMIISEKSCDLNFLEVKDWEERKIEWELQSKKDLRRFR